MNKIHRTEAEEVSKMHPNYYDPCCWERRPITSRIEQQQQHQQYRQKQLETEQHQRQLLLKSQQHQQQDQEDSHHRLGESTLPSAVERIKTATAPSTCEHRQLQRQKQTHCQRLQGRIEDIHLHHNRRQLKQRQHQSVNKRRRPLWTNNNPYNSSSTWTATIAAATTAVLIASTINSASAYTQLSHPSPEYFSAAISAEYNSSNSNMFDEGVQNTTNELSDVASQNFIRTNNAPRHFISGETSQVATTRDNDRIVITVNANDSDNENAIFINGNDSYNIDGKDVYNDHILEHIGSFTSNNHSTYPPEADVDSALIIITTMPYIQATQPSTQPTPATQNPTVADLTRPELQLTDQTTIRPTDTPVGATASPIFTEDRTPPSDEVDSQLLIPAVMTFATVPISFDLSLQTETGHDSRLIAREADLILEDYLELVFQDRFREGNNANNIIVRSVDLNVVVIPSSNPNSRRLRNTYFDGTQETYQRHGQFSEKSLRLRLLQSAQGRKIELGAQGVAGFQVNSETVDPQTFFDQVDQILEKALVEEKISQAFRSRSTVSLAGVQVDDITLKNNVTSSGGTITDEVDVEPTNAKEKPTTVAIVFGFLLVALMVLSLFGYAYIFWKKYQKRLKRRRQMGMQGTLPNSKLPITYTPTRLGNNINAVSAPTQNPLIRPTDPSSEDDESSYKGIGSEDTDDEGIPDDSDSSLFSLELKKAASKDRLAWDDFLRRKKMIAEQTQYEAQMQMMGGVAGDSAAAQSGVDLSVIGDTVAIKRTGSFPYGDENENLYENFDTANTRGASSGFEVELGRGFDEEWNYGSRVALGENSQWDSRQQQIRNNSNNFKTVKVRQDSSLADEWQNPAVANHHLPQYSFMYPIEKADTDHAVRSSLPARQQLGSTVQHQQPYYVAGAEHVTQNSDPTTTGAVRGYSPDISSWNTTLKTQSSAASNTGTHTNSNASKTGTTLEGDNNKSRYSNTNEMYSSARDRNTTNSTAPNVMGDKNSSVELESRADDTTTTAGSFLTLDIIKEVKRLSQFVKSYEKQKESRNKLYSDLALAYDATNNDNDTYDSSKISHGHQSSYDGSRSLSPRPTAVLSAPHSLSHHQQMQHVSLPQNTSRISSSQQNHRQELLSKEMPNEQRSSTTHVSNRHATDHEQWSNRKYSRGEDDSVRAHPRISALTEGDSESIQQLDTFRELKEIRENLRRRDAEKQAQRQYMSEDISDRDGSDNPDSSRESYAGDEAEKGSDASNPPPQQKQIRDWNPVRNFLRKDNNNNSNEIEQPASLLSKDKWSPKAISKKFASPSQNDQLPKNQRLIVDPRAEAELFKKESPVTSTTFSTTRQSTLSSNFSTEPEPFEKEVSATSTLSTVNTRQDTQSSSRLNAEPETFKKEVSATSTNRYGTDGNLIAYGSIDMSSSSETTWSEDELSHRIGIQRFSVQTPLNAAVSGYQFPKSSANEVPSTSPNKRSPDSSTSGNPNYWERFMAPGMTSLQVHSSTADSGSQRPVRIQGSSETLDPLNTQQSHNGNYGSNSGNDRRLAQIEELDSSSSDAAGANNNPNLEGGGYGVFKNFTRFLGKTTQSDQQQKHQQPSEEYFQKVSAKLRKQMLNKKDSLLDGTNDSAGPSDESNFGRDADPPASAVPVPVEVNRYNHNQQQQQHLQQQQQQQQMQQRKIQGGQEPRHQQQYQSQQQQQQSQQQQSQQQQNELHQRKVNTEQESTPLRQSQTDFAQLLRESQTETPMRNPSSIAPRRSQNQNFNHIVSMFEAKQREAIFPPNESWQYNSKT